MYALGNIIQNGVKYLIEKKVTVELYYNKSSIFITIFDDGMGFSKDI